MKTLTDRQRAIHRYLLRDPNMPLTVAEIAADLHLSPGTVRAALKTLERHSCVEQRGVAFTGGTTWTAS